MESAQGLDSCWMTFRKLGGKRRLPRTKHGRITFGSMSDLPHTSNILAKKIWVQLLRWFQMGQQHSHGMFWQIGWVLLCGVVLTSCAQYSNFQYVHQPVQQAARELDVQSQDVLNRVPWPEKVVSTVGEWSPCPEEEFDEDWAQFELDLALDGPFEVLERGDGQEVIFEEWRQQMSGLVQDDGTNEWGSLAAADGVVVLDVNCVRDVQRYSVSISDVASGRRAYMRSFSGGDVFDAMHLLGLELERQYTLQRHPLDGVSEEVLRSREFDFFEVDEVSAMAWRNQFEDVVERAIRRWQPMKRTSLFSTLKGELTLHPEQGSRAKLTIRGSRGAEMERYLKAAINGMSLPATPLFGGVPLHATAAISWPFSYSFEPSFLVNYRRGGNAPREVATQLKDAPDGRYEFEMSFWQLGAVEEKNVRLRQGKTRSVGKAVLMSSLVPGSGLSYASYGKKKGAPYFLGVAAFSALSWWCFRKAGQAPTDNVQEEWTEYGLFTGIGGLYVYGAGVAATYHEALEREKEMDAFLGKNADRN